MLTAKRRILRERFLWFSAVALLGYPTFSLQPQSRANFLSSSASAFLVSSSVLGSNPAECQALFDRNKKDGTAYSTNPRYIDKELQMKYAGGPGT
jgi:hypothetical protein